MKIEDMVGCAYHKPKNAIVLLKTGDIVPREVLDRIPESPQKRMLFESHGLCYPCNREFLGPKRFELMLETIRDSE
ncbi:MAG TPA: hypothetical protein VLD37_06140 [Candidatus Bilamarchaeum sp.]|nr:hypothetical protein [Candidatus Bilamarchaeum sp.]